MHLKFGRITLAAFVTLGLAACQNNSGGSSTSSVSPPAAYCPYLPSKSFSNSVTVAGRAVFEYRKDGNGEIIASGTHKIVVEATSNDTFTVTVNGTNYTHTCVTCTAVGVTTSLRTAMASDANVSVTASGTDAIVLTPKTNGGYVTVTATNANYTGVPSTQKITRYSAKPIRYAEIRVTKADGTLVQCAETDGSGDFSFPLEAGTGDHVLTIAARANNTSNTAYIMKDPTSNTYYSVQKAVGTSGSTTGLHIVAPASDSIVAGAFNILDQILDAQSYIRTQTANCNVGAATNYFPDCSPFTVAPLVYVYWEAGQSPGKYIGLDPEVGISFYLNGKRELYILGGINGNTDKSDTDHFDNSIIVHEYGHFIEDQFASPDSPGGSHDGKSIIDPRLAWGEGWADYFQAAVTGYPYYRDTYGHSGCSGTDSRGQPCTGTNFHEPIDPGSGVSYNDEPSSVGGAGEGNFREFSIARLLYDVSKPSGTSKFAEIWAVLAGESKGFKAVDDGFKSMGRFHKIQMASANAVSWNALRTTELHSAGLGTYATPLASCSSSVSMSVLKTSTDDGSFQKSDQYRNNDFYVYPHPGGSINWTVSWSGGGTVDMDLFIYDSKYMYGRESSILAYKRTSASGTSGSENISTSLPAGTYMLNVQADTSIYSGTGTSSTTYGMTLNGSAICPNP